MLWLSLLWSGVVSGLPEFNFTRKCAVMVVLWEIFSSFRCACVGGLIQISSFRCACVIKNNCGGVASMTLRLQLLSSEHWTIVVGLSLSLSTVMADIKSGYIHKCGKSTKSLQWVSCKPSWPSCCYILQENQSRAGTDVGLSWGRTATSTTTLIRRLLTRKGKSTWWMQQTYYRTLRKWKERSRLPVASTRPTHSWSWLKIELIRVYVNRQERASKITQRFLIQHTTFYIVANTAGVCVCIAL